ncbi:hypothetical protein J7K52_03160 [Candidatus Bathyarchaeota archaeon]|nr:hypothetical protein [Candidatus Bathyarchaeota archaeon]
MREDVKLKITDVKAYLLEFTVRPEGFKTYRWRKGLNIGETYIPENKMRRLLLEVETDEEVRGFAFSGHGRVMLELVREVFRPLLLGEDPLMREKIWKKIWDIDRIRQLPVYAQGPVDVALWDIAGKAAGLPVYKLLGGYRSRVKAYASTFTLPTVEDYVKLAEEAVNRGYTAIKLHVWGDVEKDIEACRAVREAVGDGVKLMLDASGAYTHEEALWAGKELEKLNYYWFEEPIRDYDIHGLKTLRSKLNIPLLVAETTWGSLFDAANHIIQGTGDIIHSDCTLKAGITGLLKTAHLCEAFGIKCQVHGPGLPNLHVICAINNCEYYESIYPEDAFHFGLKNPPIVPDKEGYVHVPEKPGLGQEIDWSWVEEHTIEEL